MTRESTITAPRDSVFDGLYHVVATVGRGRNSVVYKATRSQIDAAQQPLSDFLALKVLIGQSGNPALQIKRTRREALAMLSAIHPNVIRLHDYVADDNLCYIAMEFADRGDLKELHTQQQTAFSPELVLRLMLQILSGLEAIHRVGIIHRDIKPENLLLTGDCQLKIADFGIACLPSERVPAEEANRGVGTFDYLAPESLEEGLSTEATDVYSAAVTCYELFTGHLPFSGTSFTEQIINKMECRMLPLENFIEKPPSLLGEFLRKALSSDPRRRFATAAMFREALEQFIAGRWEPDPKPLPAKQALSAEEANETRPGRLWAKAYGASFRRKTACFPRDEIICQQDTADLLPPIDDESYYFGGSSTSVTQPGQPLTKPGWWRRFARTLFTSVWELRVLLFLALVAVMLWFVSSAEISSAVKDLRQQLSHFWNGSYGELNARGSQRGRFVSGAGFSLLLVDGHVGLLYGLLSENRNVSLVTTPIGNREQVLFVLAVPGWEPLTVDAKLLQNSAEVQLTGSGIKLSLSLVEPADPRKGILRGKYQEHISGREGEWAVW